MNNQVLIDRELLERMKDCAEAYVDIDDADCAAIQKLLATPAPIPDAGELVEVSQFLTAVMDAAGLVRHGRQSKELSEYLGKECARLRHRIVSALQADHIEHVRAMVVPDGSVNVPVEVLRLYEFMVASFRPFTSQHEQIAISLRKAKAAMLAAAPAPGDSQ